jgi:hypothetical protein
MFMQKRLMYVALVACSVFMFGKCNKDDVTPPVINFSPLTAGSTWTYSTNTGSSFTLTATSRDTAVNGKAYRVLTNSAGPNNYVTKVNNDYYRYGIFAAVGNTGIEELYLKDNVDANGTWTENRTIPVTIPGTPPVTLTVPVVLKYVIKSKGGARTVSGKNFNNVIEVRLDISATGFGALADGTFYYADGVGLVEQTINVYANALAGIPASTNTQILTSYTIK